MARRRRRQGARRLGHLARPALLRHPRARHRGGEIPLRLARRADRLSRLPEELLRRRSQGDSDFEKTAADPDTEQIHFIGKDIIYFHTLFWPAMLKFAGTPYKVPDHVYVHGFITVSGEKMSKSRGTGIDPLRYLELGMNPEWLRYYIAAKLNATVEDIDFNPDDFIARVNSDLVGKYVNIASRCARLHRRSSFDGQARAAGERLRHRADVADARTARRERRSRTCTSARIRQGAARRHGARGPRESVRRRRRSPGSWRRTRREARALQHVCSDALQHVQLLTLYLKPVLPRLAKQVGAVPERAARCNGPMRSNCCRAGIASTIPAPHAPASTRSSSTRCSTSNPCRRRPRRSATRKSSSTQPKEHAVSDNDLDRRLQQARPARGEDRQGRARRGRRQAAEADARPRRRRRAPCSPASSPPTRRRSSKAGSPWWSRTSRRAR